MRSKDCGDGFGIDEESKMIFRKATSEEMLSLWGYKEISEASPTARFFCEHISSGNAEFWTIDDNGKLIGELYVFLNMEDKDFADGKNTAYLCAFRVEEGHRGRGLGSRLAETVLASLKGRGFRGATIGVDESEELNIKLYHRLDFNTKIKDCFVDPCSVDETMQPKSAPCFWLLYKALS